MRATKLARNIGGLSLVFLSLVLGASCGDDGDDPNVCMPLAQEICYDGPAEVAGVGACRLGARTCLRDGTGFTECAGQVLPVQEDCGTALDDDCDGVVNEDCTCTPGTFRVCYTGPEETKNVGSCMAGTQSCNAEGSGYGECEGEIVPRMEDCATFADEDCDGVINQPEACTCAPGQIAPCYTGPAETEGVGICRAGTMKCLDTGGVFGPCEGEVLPLEEDCDTPEDDDCNGSSNEPAAECTCTPDEIRSCYSGPMGTLGVGKCVGGTQTCLDSGDGFGECIGDIAPKPENCATPEDDNCNGQVNEASAGCECEPGDTSLCYTGPQYTVNVGTCRAGMRTCGPNGKWLACMGQILPVDEDCATPLDENCDGSVNEPASGCFCYFEDVLTLESEDCVLDYGEPVWRTPIPSLPHEIVSDVYGTTFLLMPRIPLPGGGDDFPEFESVPSNVVATAFVGNYGPNGLFYWGRELTGTIIPEDGYAHSYNMSSSKQGYIAFTAPANGASTTAFGFDTWTWPAGTFRILYSADYYGYPLFAVAVPRYAGEPNNSIHAVAAVDGGAVYYLNGPTSSRLHRYDSFGNLSWTIDLAMNLDDMAITATDDGGVLLAFTTSASVNLGLGVLPPIAGSPSDLIVARYTASGSLVWAVRPIPTGAVFSAQEHAAVLSILGQSPQGGPNMLVRIDAKDGSVLTTSMLPGSVLPSSPHALVGTQGALYGLNNVGPTDFGIGDVYPYGGNETGSFVVLGGFGGTSWVRAPLADKVTVGSSPLDMVFAAFAATSNIDLDGTIWPLVKPTVFLARLAY